MDTLSILNSRRTKEIRELIEAQWGAVIPPGYVFLENSKGRIFIVTKSFGDIDIESLRIQSVGIYFAERTNSGLRLSIEGSQIIGPKSTRNVVEIHTEDARLWMAGEDIPYQADFKGFAIIKNNTDFLGTGNFSKTKSKILNFVPKIRRMNVIS